ncbi:uncharacterized protein V6R79_007186 [Siganus canaliculatus]
MNDHPLERDSYYGCAADGLYTCVTRPRCSHLLLHQLNFSSIISTPNTEFDLWCFNGPKCPNNTLKLQDCPYDSARAVPPPPVTPETLHYCPFKLLACVEKYVVCIFQRNHSKP